MIVPLIIVVIALCLAGAGLWMFNLAKDSERSEEVRQRLQTVPGNEETELPIAQNRKLQNPLIRWIVQLFWRAGAEISSSQALLVLLVPSILAVLIIAVAGLFWGGLISGILLLIAFGILLRLGAMRRLKIVEQLPDFLESVIRVLAAGNTLEEAFGAAARESAEPIRPLFMSVARQVKLGASIDQVLTEVGKAYRLRDLRILGLTANVNRRYGGSLRAVLKSLIVAIRQRIMAERELRALTGETRFSALVLALVPIGLSLYIYSRNTQYYVTMYHDPSGKVLLVGAILLQVAGSLALWRMLNSAGGADS